ncbi:MAG TPA: sugar ABC transporter substrate-binding protein [Acetobacteraceae bacterium]|nr:sugar ABC transporter substrate-binding protein [Acetobacteraceae bacterium]
MKLPRPPLLAAAGALAALTLPPAQPAAAKETVSVTVAQYSNKTGPWFQEAADAFEKANPDIAVKFQVVPWDTLQQKLTTDISGGDNSDMSIIGTRWLLDFVKQGIVAPLDSDMTPEFRSRFIPVFLKPSVLNGKTYGLPIAASARAMFYNKDILAKAGVNEPPATWDDVVSDCKKVKASAQKDVYCFGLQGKEIETDVYYYYAMWSYGGSIVTPDGKSGLTEPAALKAAELYKSLIDDGLTEPGPTAYNREDIQNQFKQGHLAFVMTAPFLITQIKTEAPKLNYGIIPIPKGTTQVTYGVTDSIVLFDNSKHKAAAWKFLDFIFKPEWRVKFDQNEGFLPVEQSVADMPEFAGNPGLKVFTSLLPVAKFAPLITGWEQAADATIRGLQKIYLNQEQPKPALDQAAKDVDAAISQQ